jgi:hypothetical protein
VKSSQEMLTPCYQHSCGSRRRSSSKVLALLLLLLLLGLAVALVGLPVAARWVL